VINILTKRRHHAWSGTGFNLLFNYQGTFNETLNTRGYIDFY
jgi:hypothetical protein